MHRISYRLLFCLAAIFSLVAEASANELQVRIGYLAHQPPRGPLLSNVIPEPADAGRRGAELAIVDSNSTGRFLKHRYALHSAEADSAEQLLAKARELHDGGLRLFVVNAPADSLCQLAAALPDSRDFAAAFEDKDLALRIHRLLHRLPEPYREVFLLRVLGELSFRDIGSLFEKGENWACVTYHRARKKIMEQMEGTP